MSANFYSHLEQQFLGEKECLRDTAHQRSFTFDDLIKTTARMANWLRTQGLNPGDRLMLQVQKSPENLFWYLAALRAGLIYLPLNTAYQPDELKYFTENASPGLIICDPASTEVFKRFAQCPIETLDEQGNFSQTLPESEHYQDYPASSDDTAVILYTSGTTGKPKGAMISHGNLLSNVQALSEAWAWRPDDVMLHALPIFHIHGLFVASHLPLFHGSTILFLDKFSPEAVTRFLPEATVYMGVPTNYTRLLQHQSFNQSTCGNMRLFTSGSAPLLPQTFAQMKSQTGHEIVERYGMTETGMNTSNPLHGARKPGTVGPPLPGVETRIINEAGDQVDVSEPGNLLVRGKNVFSGYWQMPEKTAEEFSEDGFFKTGDIATIDAQGYISIVGRSKDLVISGGLNVYPKEIEGIIDHIPGVKESAVIGVPHEDFGEAVTAVIVRADEQITEADIRQALQSLASFKRPKQIHFVIELPRNTMGKVQKNLLRQQFASETQS